MEETTKKAPAKKSPPPVTSYKITKPNGNVIHRDALSDEEIKGVDAEGNTPTLTNDIITAQAGNLTGTPPAFANAVPGHIGPSVSNEIRGSRSKSLPSIIIFIS